MNFKWQRNEIVFMEPTGWYGWYRGDNDYDSDNELRTRKMMHNFCRQINAEKIIEMWTQNIQ